MELMLLYVTHGIAAVAVVALFVTVIARTNSAVVVYPVICIPGLLMIYIPMVGLGTFAHLTLGVNIGSLVAANTLAAVALSACAVLGIYGLRKPEGQKKRRAASWSWKRMGVITLAALLVHLSAWWFASSRITGRLDVLEQKMSELSISLAPRKLADADNAMLVYREANKLIPEDYDWPESINGILSHDPDEAAFAPDDPLVQSFLKAMAPALKAVEPAADRKGFNPDYDFAHPSSFWIARHLNETRTLCRLWSVRAVTRAKNGDIDGAIQDLKSIQMTASYLESDPTLLGLLVNRAVRSIGIESMRRVMNETPIPADRWDELGVSKRSKASELLQRAFNMERASSATLMARIANKLISIDNIDGDGVVSPNDKLFALGYRFFLAEDDIAGFNRLMDDYIATFDQPTETWESKLDLVASDFQLYRSGMMTRILLPALKAASQAILDGEAQCRLAETAIAMVKYFQKHGEYPETLSQLSPEFIEKVPLDPFTGKSLGYVNMDKGVVLYSVGVDGIDDGGQPNPINGSFSKGDEIFVLPANGGQ